MWLDTLGGVKGVKYRYTRCKLIKKIKHNKYVYSLILDPERDFPEIEPGAFLMVWHPAYEEIPISPSMYYDDGSIRLTIKNVGPTTRALTSMEYGEYIYVRGPYGKGFDLEGSGRYLLIGGGYGSAPLIYALHILRDKGNDALYVEGAKSINEGLFIDEARSLKYESVLVTEDGSSRIKGLVTDYIINIYRDYDYILACGPNRMLLKLIEMFKDHSGINIQLSFESIVKCGVGICGSCRLGESGTLLCIDGPVLNIDTARMIFYGDTYGSESKR